jgi:hypothetical protein
VTSFIYFSKSEKGVNNLYGKANLLEPLKGFFLKHNQTAIDSFVCVCVCVYNLGVSFGASQKIDCHFATLLARCVFFLKNKKKTFWLKKKENETTTTT